MRCILTFSIQRGHVSTARFTLQVLVLEHLEGDVVERALAMKEADMESTVSAATIETSVKQAVTFENVFKFSGC